MELRLSAQMPLAEQSSPITVLLEHLRPGNAVRRQTEAGARLLRSDPVRDAQLSAEAAGEERCATRRADRGAGKGVKESRAFAGQPVDAWRAALAVPKGAHSTRR